MWTAAGTASAATAQPELVGRGGELAQLRAVITHAREARGATLVVEGEPGVGKTALLRAAAGEARDFSLLEVTGIEVESALPFGAISSLVQAHRAELAVLPSPQAHALRGALGLEAGSFDRLACFAGLLELLARLASRRPLLILADDVQWFDAESREALVFAARRLSDERVAVLVGRRSGAENEPLGDLPILSLSGLALTSVRQLLGARGRPVDASVARIIWAQTGGSPLAVGELARSLSDEQLTGAWPLPDPLPVGERLEDALWRQIEALPEKTREALVVVAASYTAEPSTIADALSRLQLPLSVLEPAEDRGVLTIGGGTIVWRHPLVRSAVYHHAPASGRRGAHAALADSTGDARLEDHRAWHRAAATVGTSAEVADALDGVAADAVRRGAFATAIRAYRQAALLSPDEDPRADRELSAA